MASFFEDIIATFNRLEHPDAATSDVISGVESVEPSDIPEPYRSLLVHDKDMTGRLAEYWGLPITLRPIEVVREGDILYREVVLTAGRERLPVEAGAIKIHLDCFPPETLHLITESRQPLGAILTVYRIPYVSAPRGFFRLPANANLQEVFGDTREQTLYGRRNRLTTPTGEPLADVIEILPATQK